MEQCIRYVQFTEKERMSNQTGKETAFSNLKDITLKISRFSLDKHPQNQNDFIDVDLQEGDRLANKDNRTIMDDGHWGKEV